MAAEAAVSFAVEKLGKLLIEKAVFLKGVKGEVEWVRDELKAMQCFLKDAAKRQSESEVIRNWISDIRKVAHDAEDVIEIFVLKVQSKSLMKRYGCFPNHLYHLNKVGEEIKSIRQRITDIQDRRERYDIQKDEPSTRTQLQEEIETRRRLAYWKPDQQVVGLEEDVKQLLRETVLEMSEGLSVAAIVGMGGIGKSTLASKIYNHPEVTRRFEFCAWVVVSSEFTSEDIMKQILLKLGISDDELKRIMSIDDKLGRQEELKKEVHKRLTGKRYFIVLDDVWEAAHWESFSTAFPDDGDKGSRLLLTSRNQVIITHDGYVHNMKPLGDTESRDLFMKKAFGGNTSYDECPEELKKVGKKILKKCGGLPLAISVVGGVLAKKTRSKSEWEKVHKEMKSHLERSKDLSNISGILELSYHNLSPELKACFLCLAFLKEDATIKVKKLVRIWAAHGLVPQEAEEEDDVRMEEVARDYLNELIGRNMVQVKETTYDVIKACQVHDLLRDLSIRKAEEEIDFEVLKEEINSHKSSFNKPRHRVIYYNGMRFVYSTNRNKHLRSLFINRDSDPPYIIGGPSSYWKSFELLRFLDMGNAVFGVLPKGIGDLTGLKYLRMRYGGYKSRFPRSWAKLINLEVLDLRGPYNGAFIKIGKVIRKMERLRHLYATVESCRVGRGKMRKLQTVHRFRLNKNSSNVWEIQGLSGVSKLGIEFDASDGPNNNLFTCLSLLPNLFHLTLLNVTSSTDLQGLTSLHHVTRLKICFPFSNDKPMPSSLYFPPNLLHLTLSEMWLIKDLMTVLEELPNLLYLKIKESRKDYGVNEITISGFPKLKVLHLQNMERMWKMVIEESAMPELNQLIISECPNLDVENAPERIKSVTIVHSHYTCMLHNIFC